MQVKKKKQTIKTEKFDVNKKLFQKEINHYESEHTMNMQRSHFIIMQDKPAKMQKNQKVEEEQKKKLMEEYLKK